LSLESLIVVMGLPSPLSLNPVISPVSGK
jgi:hypothetical protein